MSGRDEGVEGISDVDIPQILHGRVYSSPSASPSFQQEPQTAKHEQPSVQTSMSGARSRFANVSAPKADAN